MYLFQTKEKKPLVILFSKDAISCMHRAAVASINTVDEAHYLFLKKFSQVTITTALLILLFIFRPKRQCFPKKIVITVFKKIPVPFQCRT